MNKVGGFFLTLIIVIVLIVIGSMWVLQNMNVNTDVNVDFSRKETVKEVEILSNKTGSDASIKCLEEGFRVEVQLDENGFTYGVCFDEYGSECNEWDYYHGNCELERGEEVIQINGTAG